MGGGEMAREMTSSMRKVTSYDQGHLNWLVHTDALRHLSVGLIPPTVGPVINAGRYPQVPLDPEGDVVDENGEVVAVVHQWFRGELEDNVLQRWGLQRPWMETRQRQEMNAQNSDTPTLSVATSNDSTRSSNPSDVHMTIPSHDTSAPVVFAVGLGASHPSALQRVHSKLWGLHQLNAPGVVSVTLDDYHVATLTAAGALRVDMQSALNAAQLSPGDTDQTVHRLDATLFLESLDDDVATVSLEFLLRNAVSVECATDVLFL